MTEDINAGPPANREYKDSVFTLLFDEEEAIRDISGALLGEKIDPNATIEKTTLKNVLLGGWRNDLSFVLNGRLIVLVEHQSTINQNMPLRMLHYVCEIYNHLYNKEDLYKEKKISIPMPIFIVLYNGEKEINDDYLEYRLSDLFSDADKQKGLPYLEVVVKFYNINIGHSVEMVEQSLLLSGYVAFVAEIRENKKTMNLEQAMKKAVEDCIKKGILADFLNKHKEEVVNMLVAEWDYELEKKVLKDESRQEGRLEGRLEALREVVEHMYKGGFSVTEIVKATGLSEKDVNDILGL
jgi:predicted transposase/invertase (TIGR01784 family)